MVRIGLAKQKRPWRYCQGRFPIEGTRPFSKPCLARGGDFFDVSFAPDARAAWDEVAPMLEGMGVLTRIDGRALSRYCHLWARWRKTEDFIRERGEMYPIKDDAGQVKCFQQWPQVAIAHRLAQQLTRLEQEFGMTPSARARLLLTPQSQEVTHAKSRFFEAG